MATSCRFKRPIPQDSDHQLLEKMTAMENRALMWQAFCVSGIGSLAKLVDNSNKYGSWFMGYISTVDGFYKPTYH